MKLPDPDQVLKSVLKKVFRAELKSWCLVLVFYGIFQSIAYVVFGPESLLWMSFILGFVAVLIIVDFVAELVVDKKFRKSFMNYLLGNYDE